MLIPLLPVSHEERLDERIEGVGGLKNGSRTKLFSFAPLIRSPVPFIPGSSICGRMRSHFPCCSCVLLLPNYSLLSHEILCTRVIPVAGEKEEKIDNLEQRETALEHAIAGFQAK